MSDTNAVCFTNRLAEDKVLIKLLPQWQYLLISTIESLQSALRGRQNPAGVRARTAFAPTIVLVQPDEVPESRSAFGASEGDRQEQGTCQAVTFRHHVTDTVEKGAVAIALARLASLVRTLGRVISGLALATLFQFF